tara:strand:- start:221 stop:349 length:129 start_codon:yes stop_codon:yes gene_type:complete
MSDHKNDKNQDKKHDQLKSGDTKGQPQSEQAQPKPETATSKK